jgi:hypothetical protein
MNARHKAAALGGILHVLAVVAPPLALQGVIVGLLRDGQVLVPPPAEVAEQFVDGLACHRWAPARRMLAPDQAAGTGDAQLRELLRQFEARHGRIERVQGQPGSRGREEAWASALVITSRGEVAVALPLRRHSGEWRIAGLAGFLPPPPVAAATPATD